MSTSLAEDVASAVGLVLVKLEKRRGPKNHNSYQLIRKSDRRIVAGKGYHLSFGRAWEMVLNLYFMQEEKENEKCKTK